MAAALVLVAASAAAPAADGPDTPQAASAAVTAPEPASTPSPGDEYQNPKDGSVLVWIPAGTFELGSADGDGDEAPVNTVQVAGFWMGKYEVTNEQFARFLEAEQKSEPWYWGEEGFDDPKQPVVGVSWARAVEYCEWAGLRLPTEAEWEYAARCGQGHPYPTSTGELTHDLANYQGAEGLDTWQGPSPVGSFPANAFGLFDLAGNAWELTSTTYTPYPYDPTDGREDISNRRNLRVSRGGGWQSLPVYCRTSSRHRFSAHLTYDYSGFRVALSPAQLAQQVSEQVAVPAETEQKADETGEALICPGAVPLGEVKLEIVSIDLKTPDDAAGVDPAATASRGLQYTDASVSVRVSKPSGMSLTLSPIDLTLHYVCAFGANAAPCGSISPFRLTQEPDESADTSAESASVWKRQTTGTYSMQADEVYFDAVFPNLEPGLTDVWLCVSQPTTTAPFHVTPNP